MREIEVMAWDKRQKKMYEVFKIFFNVGNSAYVAVIGDGLQCEERDDSDSALLQYTGRKDKNGEKIFVSHIVKYVLSDPYHIYEDCDRPGLGVIRLGEYLQDGSNGEYGPTKCLGFYIQNIDGKADRHEQTISMIDGIDSLEIIGNEFENSDLLPKPHD